VKRLRRGSFVSRAVRLVPIVVVLDYIGIQNPGTPEGGISVKVHCPFQETHPPDRSGEKDMRLYSDGKAFCHLCAEGWDSVQLAARLWELTLPEAARRLLAMRGLDVSEEDEAFVQAVTPEQLRASAVAALGVWADANDVSRFTENYVRCLRLADQIQKSEHVDAWLRASKDFLTRSIRNA
jgi:hypothetical protein